MSFTFTSRTQLMTAIRMWCDNEFVGTASYGPITTWNTRGVTSMEGLMSPHYDTSGNYHGHEPAGSLSSCNPPIGGWDTSQVTDM